VSAEEEYVHLYVEAGPDKGRQVVVPEGGARLGRSESNDVVLNDDSLSRFHCRVFFKPDKSLWVMDLGSTNETLVNHKPVQESALHTGDRIGIGETTLLVINDRLVAESAEPATPPVPPGPAAAPPPDVDLGFQGRPPAKPAGELGKVVFAVVAVVVLVVGVFLMRKFSGGAPSLPADDAPVERSLEITYEKVEASPDNIFRYDLTLRDNLLAVRIDNLEDGRHLSREAAISPEMAAGLADTIEASGFFGLQPSYQGMAANVWDSWDLSVTIDRKTHRVHVLNRVEPENVRRVRETIEEYARNELGLAALALPPERLTQLAYEAVLQGQKLFDAREVHYQNLSLAIRAFQEAQLYLEGIEPKPDFYAIAVAGLEECRRALQTRYDEELFLAERGVKLRDWQTAANHLRVIIQLIPDRADERHEAARKKLIDVERRLQR
jgi:hypothetical protein